jgi:hypothetical protein
MGALLGSGFPKGLLGVVLDIVVVVLKGSKGF